MIRYLTETPIAYVADIAKFLDEAKANQRRIYMSTMAIVEVRPSQLQKKNFDNFQELIDDLQADINLIGPSVPILMQASRLRNHAYHRTPKQDDEKNRVMSGMDAVHLATCLHVKNALGIGDVEFCTFDDGKGRNYEEKAVSLLTFNAYSEHLKTDPDVLAIRELTRCKPAHPEMPMI